MLDKRESLCYNTQALRVRTKYRGVEQLEARRAHNPEVVGSSPASATIKPPFSSRKRWFFLLFWPKTIWVKTWVSYLTHILTHNRLSRNGFGITKQHPANPKTTTSRIVFSICFTYQFCFPKRNSKGSTDQNQPIPFLVPFVLLVAVCRYSMRSFYGCTIKNRDQAFGLIP